MSDTVPDSLCANCAASIERIPDWVRLPSRVRAQRLEMLE